MSKYIFVTGGVVSSVGKGIAVASIGNILKSRGLSVSVLKMDPYLNVDPGNMSPYQHGEVFITKDGAETDLDLGNYERFIDIELTANSSVSSGQIYSSVITKERRGDYGGGTIQVVPHLTGEIKQRFKALSEKSQSDVILVEVGGTVGDIEGQPFLEAIRQMRKDVGRDNVLYIHVTLLPYINSTKELKTKPTQHSVNELRRIGIQPDVIICRSDIPIPDSIRDKISLFCDVDLEAVIPLLTVSTIYEVPIVLEEFGMTELIVKRLHLKEAGGPDLSLWKDMVSYINSPCEEVNIALVGKYVELEDAYYSVRESLCHAGFYHKRKINLNWVHSEDLAKEGGESLLRHAQGIIVPGAFDTCGIEGMVKAAEYARQHKVPYFGICFGMQAMVTELASASIKSGAANFGEAAAKADIESLSKQLFSSDNGNPMRVGEYPCKLIPGTIAASLYGQAEIGERHRYRYEFNNEYRDALAAAGLVYSGLSPDDKLVEIYEMQDHVWMLGCHFHPEFLSRPGRPHPLFRGFIGAAKDILREGAQPSLPLNS
ncbi:MAG: CTP synthase [Dehalococcoidales bacterium]